MSSLPCYLTRRQFTLAAGGSLLASAAQTASSRYFYFGVIADTHIIDEFYKGPEGSPLDTESIFKTTARLAAARDFLNALKPSLDRVFLVGDYFHNYPSTEWKFYFENKTRIDQAKTLTDGFKMPVHAGFGNHDYDVPRLPRQFSHDLFRDKLNLQPYYAVDHKGFKFVHLNNFLGETWNPGSVTYRKDTGSLGREQLEWFEAQLRQGRPTFVFIHYPLMLVQPAEYSDFGLHPLLKRYQDTVQRVISGHWHKWFDFARTFGPPHYVMGATRFDEDAYMIIEVDTEKTTHRFVNSDCVDWSTHYSRPYRPA